MLNPPGTSLWGRLSCSPPGLSCDPPTGTTRLLPGDIAGSYFCVLGHTRSAASSSMFNKSKTQEEKIERNRRWRLRPPQVYSWPLINLPGKYSPPRYRLSLLHGRRPIRDECSLSLLLLHVSIEEKPSQHAALQSEHVVLPITHSSTPPRPHAPNAQQLCFLEPNQNHSVPVHLVSTAPARGQEVNGRQQRRNAIDRPIEPSVMTLKTHTRDIKCSLMKYPWMLLEEVLPPALQIWY